MDTTGKSRAEIDALRALAAKAHEEGQELARHNLHWPESRSASDARQWAEEELPYPTVTRDRVVWADRLCFRRVSAEPGTVEYGVGRRPKDGRFGDAVTLCGLFPLHALKQIASLLTEDELREVMSGHCGPTETVEAE